MSEINTPFETDDREIKKVLGRKQPALLYLYDGSEKNKPLDDTLKREAKRNADDVLIVRVDATANRETYAKYGHLKLPALVTLTPAFFGRKVKSTAEAIRTGDICTHLAHLLHDEPLPEPKPQSADNAKHKGAKHVKSSTWRKEVLKSKTPVLVDFWAAWCGPCNAVAPFIDQMADKYAGQVKVVKLNTEESRKIAGDYSIQSIPTFIMFEGGQPVARISGASPRAIENMIQEVVVPE